VIAESIINNKFGNVKSAKISIRMSGNGVHVASIFEATRKRVINNLLPLLLLLVSLWFVVASSIVRLNYDNDQVNDGTAPVCAINTGHFFT